MVVSGRVKMSITMNVCGLVTDAVETDKWGNVKITDPDKFFIDWSDDWENGVGELSGASDISVDLEAEEADD